jgi:iron complex transport system permease protein
MRWARPTSSAFTTGAATGAIVQIILSGSDPIAVSLAAVLSGMMTAVLVFLLALKGRVTGGYRLVLVGIGVGATLTGVNTMLLVASDLDRSISAQIWLAGSLTARSWSHAGSAALGLALIVPIALLHARRLALLEMGDDAASQLGVSVERTRLVMVMTGVGLTAMATAAAGPIAFIALAGPQLARRLCRAPEAPLLPGAGDGRGPVAGGGPDQPALPIRPQPADRSDDRPAGWRSTFCGCWLAAKTL